MKKKALVSLGIALCTLIITSCEGGKDECVEQFMKEGLSEKEALDKCDEELVETVEVLK